MRCAPKTRGTEFCNHAAGAEDTDRRADVMKRRLRRGSAHDERRSAHGEGRNRLGKRVPTRARPARPNAGQHAPAESPAAPTNSRYECALHDSRTLRDVVSAAQALWRKKLPHVLCSNVNWTPKYAETDVGITEFINNDMAGIGGVIKALWSVHACVRARALCACSCAHCLAAAPCLPTVLSATGRSTEFSKTTIIQIVDMTIDKTSHTSEHN